ncbi:MAG: hypothetical protein IKP04_01325 [Candidatus Methanomethylophilaceae archaeon]|nr:hypothetical protein [Candidatus Methanomethylophilaceae archaeon]
MPTIENADVQVNLDAYFVGGMLSYSIELVDAVESETYYAVLLEGGTIIQQETIVDSQLSGSLTGLDGSKDHSVEVRTGLPPLLVLASQTIPGEPIWAELDNYSATFNSIEFSVHLHGTDEGAYVTFSDPETGSTLFSSPLTDGRCSATVPGLMEAHTYILTVESPTTTYMQQGLSTLSPIITLDSLSASKNTITFSVTVEGMHSELTAELLDTETSAAVYSTVLTEGTNTGTVSELKYNHTYALSVASSETSFINQSITTESLPIEVELKDLSVSENNVSYVVDVAANGQTVTAYLYGPSGDAVYSMDLTDGTNSGTISGLEYGKEYKFEVSHELQTFVSQTVKIESKDISVELISLEVEGSTIFYEIQVTGDSETVTLYLYDTSEEESLVASVELSEGINSDMFTNLEFGKEYRITASSDSETFVNETFTIEEEPLDPIVVNSIKALYDRIVYDVTVNSYASIPLLTISSNELGVITSVSLNEGDNRGEFVHEHLSKGSRYVVQIEATDYHSSESIVIPGKYDFSIESGLGEVNFSFTINDELSNKTIFFIDCQYYNDPKHQDFSKAIYFETPSNTTTEKTITGLDYNTTYRLGVLEDGGDPHEGADVVAGAAKIDVTSKTYSIDCLVTLASYDPANKPNIVLYPVTGGEPIDSIEATGIQATYTFNGLNARTEYIINVVFEEETIASSNVVTTLPMIDIIYIDGKEVEAEVHLEDGITVTVGLYTDYYCTNVLEYMECSGSTTVNYGSLEYGKEYYIGVKDSSVLLVSEKVETSQLVWGDLELTSDGLAYSAYLYGNVSGKLWLYEEASGRYIESVDIAYPEDIIMGTFNDWEYGHTYSLLAILESPSFSKTLDDITIPFPSLTASSTDTTINYEITSTSSIAGYVVYLIPSATSSSDYLNTTITEGMLHEGKYLGSFSDLEYGSYYLVINDSGSTDPVQDPYVSSGTVIVGPISNHSLTLEDDGRIKISIDFTSELTGDLYLLRGDTSVEYTAIHGSSVTDYFSEWVTGYTYTSRVVISGHTIDLDSLPINIPIPDNPVNDSTFVFSGNQLSYSLTLSVGVEGTVQLIYGDQSVESALVSGKNITGTFSNWERGKTYTLKLVIGETSFNVNSVEIPNLVTNMSCSVLGKTITYSIDYSSNINGLVVFFLKNNQLAGSYAIEETSTSGTYTNSYTLDSNCNYGDYELVINDNVSSDYKVHAYGVKEVSVPGFVAGVVVTPGVNKIDLTITPTDSRDSLIFRITLKLNDSTVTNMEYSGSGSASYSYDLTTSGGLPANTYKLIINVSMDGYGSTDVQHIEKEVTIQQEKSTIK